ncbi:hypothetical protein [Corallococcus macrosporus]|uniref:Uncharacterized protein n=1 Tax=Myxococcus fulvus (strain ATCC BAA-855 / HW-1) TaxID=483219 RepID=F8C9A2_MYXFH|nr:hypothetical protein [Corallococcus macrosporus]AEI65803.1 hypothetical protein LILAB_19505 [Corallococcus macrosporus]
MARNRTQPSLYRLSHWNFGRADRQVRAATGSHDWVAVSPPTPSRPSGNRLNPDIPVLLAAVRAQVELDPDEAQGVDFDLEFASY